MRATSGAIDSVRIFPRDLTVSATTIDDAPPLGLCGTGLIDALAEMFLAGVLDRSGRFQVDRAPERFRTREEDGRPEFLLVSAAESGSGRDVVISQADVENLIRTKGSIYAAADSLVHSRRASPSPTSRRSTSPAHSATGWTSPVASPSGCCPRCPPSGSTSSATAPWPGRSWPCSAGGCSTRCTHMRDRISYQELMVDPAYMDKFTSACFLPHTDISRFPVAWRRGWRSRRSDMPTSKHGYDCE